MNVRDLELQLLTAQQLVADGERMIAEEKRLIADLRRAGKRLPPATTLRALEQLQLELIERRDRLEREVAVARQAKQA
jgi:hypothetical protein